MCGLALSSFLRKEPLSPDFLGELVPECWRQGKVDFVLLNAHVVAHPSLDSRVVRVRSEHLFPIKLVLISRAFALVVLDTGLQICQRFAVLLLVAEKFDQSTSFFADVKVGCCLLEVSFNEEQAWVENLPGCLAGVGILRFSLAARLRAFWLAAPHLESLLVVLFA